jgi:hypothetical protein
MYRSLGFFDTQIVVVAAILLLIVYRVLKDRSSVCFLSNEMQTYVKAFLIAGVIVPIFLHMIASESMPWWPDTVSMGIAFGACAVVLVWKARTDREMNHRVWNTLTILARHRRSR